MRLAFSIFNYFPYGGVQRDMMRIASSCLQAGHSIDIYTMSWRAEKPANINIHIVPVKAFTNDSRAIAFSNQLQAIFPGENYDLTIGFNKMSGLDICFVGDDCFKTRLHRNKNFFCRFLPRYRHYAKLEEAVFSIHSSTQVMLLTPKQQLEYHQAYQTPFDRFCLLPPGLLPSTAEEHRERVKQLLLIASNFHNKGLDRAIRALAGLQDKTYTLMVVGGDDVAPYQKLAEKLKVGDRVKFLGAQDDLTDLLNSAKILIHPARVEGAGMVLLEALIAGLPVLTTDSCGYGFHVKESKAGIVLNEPFRQEVLNDALTDMLNEEKWQKWHKNALEYAKITDLYSLGQKAVEFIENVAWSRQQE